MKQENRSEKINPELTVIMPAYNEEDRIASNLQVCCEELQESGLTWELIVVNDGSADNTLQKLQSCVKEIDNLRVLSYQTNMGRGFALRTGFNHARGSYIVTTESDLTWGKEIIQRLLQELKTTNADVVIASPHMKGGGLENVPILRRLVSQIGNKLFSLSLPGNISMSTGMTRGYRASVLQFLDLESNRKEIHVEILYKALEIGLNIREIPCVLRWPEDGSRQKGRGTVRFSLMAQHLLLGFLIRPFILFGSLGFSTLR